MIYRKENTGIIKQNKSSENTPLAQQFTTGSLLRFTLPTISMMVFMGLYTVVDSIFISRYVSTLALSALNICTPVLYALVGLAGMLATGGGAITGQRLGAGNHKGARQSFSLFFFVAFLLGICMCFLGIFFLDELLLFLGATASQMPYCRAYLFCQLLFAPWNILSVFFQNSFVTAGRPALGLWLGVGGGLVNILLDWFFMGPLAMGIGGASLATGLGYCVSAFGGLVFFSNKSCILRFLKPRFSIKELAKGCANGASEMVSQLSCAVTTLAFNRVMLRLAGENGVAAITACLYAQFLITSLFIGFAMGVAPVFSYRLGGGNRLGVQELFWRCVKCVGAASLCACAIGFVCGPFAARLFDPSLGPVYGYILHAFSLFPFAFVFCGLNLFCSALFTALGQGLPSALLSFSRTFVLLLAALLVLPRLLGIAGVWLAVPLAEAAACLLAIFFLAHSHRRKRIP